MRFTILGSCSGTEAMPGRRHTSTALEAGGRLYLLDAGDSCGYTAHLLGIDVTKIRAIFISHPHIDHVGGLPYLFFLMQKLMWREGKDLDTPFAIYTPSPEVVAGARLLLGAGRYPMDALVTHPVEDGLLFDDGNLRVTALHNAHLGESAAPWHSFSFLLELEGKRVVYSGDVKSVTELESMLNCDLLLMETGHHDPVQVAKYLKSLPNGPKRLVYVHHGRAMLDDCEGCVAAAREILGDAVDAAYDGMKIDL